MAAHAFWAVFYSSQQPNEIGPTAENNDAAITPPIFFLKNGKHCNRCCKYTTNRVQLCLSFKNFEIFHLEIPQLRLPWYSTAATFIRGGAINLKRRPASNWGWVDPDRIEHIGDCHIKSFNGLRGWTTVRAAAPSMALLPSLLVFDSCLEILLLILLIDISRVFNPIKKQWLAKTAVWRTYWWTYRKVTSINICVTN